MADPLDSLRRSIELRLSNTELGDFIFPTTREDMLRAVPVQYRPAELPQAPTPNQLPFLGEQRNVIDYLLDVPKSQRESTQYSQYQRDFDALQAQRAENHPDPTLPAHDYFPLASPTPELPPDLKELLELLTSLLSTQ